MKYPFVVTVETDVVVMAEDAASAEKYTKSHFDNMEINGWNCDISASRMTHYPGDWTPDCIPYGSDDDKKLIEILENDEIYQTKLRELKEIRDKYCPKS